MNEESVVVQSEESEDSQIVDQNTEEKGDDDDDEEEEKEEKSQAILHASTKEEPLHLTKPLQESNKRVKQTLNTNPPPSSSPSPSPSSVPDSSALEDSSFDTLEEQTALSKSVPEVRDIALSRFSKRFRFTNRYVKLAKYASDNETYYPRDHVSDGQLWSARKRMIDGERQTLRSLASDFKPLLPFYQNFSAYLQENPTAGIISAKQWETLNALSGTAQSHYRKSINAKLSREMNRRYREDTKRRSRLLRRFVRRSADSPARCDGCKVETPFELRVSGGSALILRKFAGNREEFTIYNSTFCRTAGSA